MVDTIQFQVSSLFLKKTAEPDAALLALYVSKGLPPEMHMKNERHGHLASVARTHYTPVKLRAVLKNKVNNILSPREINVLKEAPSREKKHAEVARLFCQGSVLLDSG